MNNFTLKQLRYLVALDRHGHFGRAADACAVTQPALSIQIKELETSLGTPLVERSPRGLRMTPVGENFVMRAKDILRAVAELDDLARVSKGPLSGRLRLGVIPTVAPYLLPEILKKLAANFPTLDVIPRETVTKTLLKGLREYELDAAIVALPVSEPLLEEFLLFEEEFVLVRHGREAQMPLPSPSELLKMRLLLLEEGHCFRDQALSYCNVGGVKARDVMEGSSLSTLVRMVGAGLGMTLIPEMAVPFEVQSESVEVTTFARPAPSRKVGMIWRKSNPLAPQLFELAKTLQAHQER
ncbi:LysR substrate-binding domain-containing protein [Halocynthiibacter namhaensis]|uniref:LysR substrate-binding domain-containing protein n=1 Tax=Halocynthiibacter namhaensis TaxID=1290553 RepID=UPI0005796BCD|nr:LysR substrate-binding domain-containing protein [Halocynthiibacter namhaensis]